MKGGTRYLESNKHNVIIMMQVHMQPMILGLRHSLIMTVAVQDRMPVTAAQLWVE